jgi:hypothetical protein
MVCQHIQACMYALSMGMPSRAAELHLQQPHLCSQLRQIQQIRLEGTCQSTVMIPMCVQAFHAQI